MSNTCQRDDQGNFVAHYGSFELRSAYQPIFRIGRRNAESYGFEGLIRVLTARGQRLRPDYFFPLVQIEDRFMVENLCRELHLRNMARFSDLPSVLFINFDPSVYDDRVRTDEEVTRIEALIDEIGMSSDRIVCEITEKRARTAGSLMFLVERLRAAGYRIAIDDYGADDSDADRTRAIAPDIVKFDAAWIKRLLETPPGYNLLRTMVSQFHDQDIETLFEGLEERWQLDLASEMGVTMAQGFILARPELAPSNFAELFVTDRSDVFKMSDAPLEGFDPDPVDTGEPEDEEHYRMDVLSAYKRGVFGRHAG